MYIGVYMCVCIYIYIVVRVFLFNTVIYVFLLLYLCIPIYVYVSSSCQLALFGYPDWGFPWFFPSCKPNARVKPAKTGHGPHSSKNFVLFYVLFVLCRSVYCLCVNVYCTTATGWLPNCSYQIYQISKIKQLHFKFNFIWIFINISCGLIMQLVTFSLWLFIWLQKHFQ